MLRAVGGLLLLITGYVGMPPPASAQLPPPENSDRIAVLAAAAMGDKWGYIDRKGAFVITPRFDRVSDFADLPEMHSPESPASQLRR
jgi:hypothetical protein